MNCRNTVDTLFEATSPNPSMEKMGRMDRQQVKKRIFFDRKDHELLNIVNDVLGHEDPRSLKKLLIPYLHPHGIKEMAASTGLRIAYAVVKLFRSLERDNAEDRIHTLRALRNEVLSSPGTEMRKNRARVLIQIMKELVREEDEGIKLQLARDFREAATGRPRAIARQLLKYHLVEMPEEWNQIAFDDHVHDANTKGRKSATHLIMDAWIKGIRRLRVIYYNYVHPEVAQELSSGGDHGRGCARGHRVLCPPQRPLRPVHLDSTGIQ